MDCGACEPSLESAAFLRSHVQPAFCPSLEDVRRAHRPFALDEERRFPLRHSRAEGAAEIHRRRRAGKQFVNPRTVPARIAEQQRLREPRIAPAQFAYKRVETGGAKLAAR